MQSRVARRFWGLLRERNLFLYAWLKAPLKTGSILPSSRFLARHMAMQVEPHSPGWVVEVGAGTGVFTHALLKHGIKPERLLVVERERRLCALLQRQFPHLHIARGDAAKLEDILSRYHAHRLHAVVSGLPLRSLAEEKVEAIIRQFGKSLQPGGLLVQFTYGLRSPVPRRLAKQLHLKPIRSRRVWLNFPPAAVWVYTREQ